MKWKRTLVYFHASLSNSIGQHLVYKSRLTRMRTPCSQDTLDGKFFCGEQTNDTFILLRKKYLRHFVFMTFMRLQHRVHRNEYKHDVCCLMGVCSQCGDAADTTRFCSSGTISFSYTFHWVSDTYFLSSVQVECLAYDEFVRGYYSVEFQPSYLYNQFDQEVDQFDV